MKVSFLSHHMLALPVTLCKSCHNIKQYKYLGDSPNIIGTHIQSVIHLLASFPATFSLPAMSAKGSASF